MRIETIRWVDVNVGKVLCFLLTIWRKLFSPFSRTPKGQPRSILFVKFIEQGATVIANSAIQRAIQEVGRDKVYFCVFEANRPILDIMDIIPQENIITISDENLWSFTWSTLKALKKTRKLKIEATVDMEFFSRASAIFAYLSGANYRVGLHRFTSEYSYRGRLMTHEVQHNAYLHTAKAYHLLVECLFNSNKEIPAPKVPLAELPDRIPNFKVDPLKKSLFQQKLEGEIGSDIPDQIILLNANSSDMLPLRRWELNKFVTLAEALLKSLSNCHIVLTGTQEEAKNADEMLLMFDTNRITSMAGKTTLEELFYLFELSDLLISNDSGPTHFASMCPIDVLVLFGPETPQLYGPVGDRIHIIWKQLSCSPCINAINHRFSPCNDNQCMKQITVTEVYEKAMQVLSLKEVLKKAHSIAIEE